MNCRKERTSYKVLIRLVQLLDNKFPKRGYSPQDLLDILIEFLNRYNLHILIVLDELNLANEEVLGVLYQLLTLGYIEYYDRDRGEITKIRPAKGFKLIATANPATYTGRNRLSDKSC